MASSAAALAIPLEERRPSQLRAVLAERFPDALLLPQQARPGLSTGLADLDRILPNGGLPRGRITAWQSSPSGATALLRAACENLLARGDRAAWIDGRHTIGPDWTSGPTVIRPATNALAVRAAEILIRSGGFPLVVLTGIDPQPREMLRLSRMIHEGQGAFVALTERSWSASLRIRSRFLPDRIRWALGPFGEPARVESIALEVRAATPGWSRTAVLSLEVTTHELRLSLDPTLADRRGLLD